MKSELTRAIEKVLRDAHPRTRWESLESFLERQFGDEAEPKVRALQEYQRDGVGSYAEVGLMMTALERELGRSSRLTARHPEMRLEGPGVQLAEVVHRIHAPEEDQVAVKKPKAKPRSGFQAAKQEAAKASGSSKKRPASKPAKKPATTKKRPPRKPPSPPGRPRPIYDQLAAGQVTQMDRRDLVPWPGLNPRTVFDQAELQELADSINAEGVRVPLVVKLNEKAPHWIAYGERRWRASELAGVDVLPVIVMSLEERQAFLEAVLENAARKALSPMEEARALDRIKGYYPEKKQAELGAIFGHAGDQPWVSNRLRLLRLPLDVQQLCDDGIVSATSLRDSFGVFLQLKDPKMQAKVWKAAREDVLEHVEKVKGTLPLGDDQVARLVGAAAAKRSNALARYELMHVRPGVQLVTVERHEKGCDCGGPRFSYNGYMGSEVRCFNAEWHKAEAAKVRARLEAKTIKQKQQLAEPSVTGAPVLGERAAATWSWPVKQDVIPQKARIPPHTLLAFQRAGAWFFPDITVPDVDLLDPELVYQVESEDDEGRPSVDLVYLDPEVLGAACKALDDTLAGWTEQRKREALEAELAAIGRSRITPADLVELLSMYEVAEDIEAALVDLGAQLPKDDTLDADDYTRLFFEAVEGEVLVRAALLVAHRERVRRAAGERRTSYGRRRSGVEDQVKEELGAIQMAKLLALLSFVPKVIEHPTTEETGANGGERAGAEEGDEVDAQEEAEAAGLIG